MSEYTKDQLIELGRAAARKEGDAKWELGDLALAYAPMGSNGAHNGSEELLREYADAVEVEHEALRRYRAVANAFPPGTRVPGASWVVHRELAGHEDRFEIIAEQERWTHREILRRLDKPPRLGHSVARDTITNAPTAKRAEFARELLADEDVAREVVNDSTARASYNRAEMAYHREAREADERRRQQRREAMTDEQRQRHAEVREAAEEAHRASVYADIRARFDSAQHALKQAAEMTRESRARGELADDDRFALLDAVARVEKYTVAARHMVTVDMDDVDAELARMISEEI